MTILRNNNTPTLSSVVESLTTTSATTNNNNNRNNIVKAILFDIDGTLVNSDSIHFAVFKELLWQEEDFRLSYNNQQQQQRQEKNDQEKHNNPIDEEFFRQRISGRSNGSITADLFPSWSIEKRDAFSIRKEERFREIATQSDRMKKLQMPGLDRLRDWVDSNRLGKVAVTNAPRLNGEVMLIGIGYADWFGTDGLIIGDECERPKPDPSPYLTACQRITVVIVSPKECIVFEDSPSGATAGVAAGAYVIGIKSGQDEATLLDAGCQFVIQDFEDVKLWDYLDRLTPIPPTTLSSSSSSS
ncbi:HAD-like protein [Fragilariopsis cylindrus CCMP1102]|uniref:HAD-like protein n=1 Tax=Fragilariopsis cylindrus CCMP1102 TaxID=635003 RepID=A0A1E7EJK5_9STRA|nr:HAD-like protein [Fragilariopsis cylindrus CCMP1102]|eukprot:OEU06081.1 HAD-like protein [Fragilariopsis cylindrus CCMP1102]